jgi:hypothetical protein
VLFRGKTTPKQTPEKPAKQQNNPPNNPKPEIPTKIKKGGK